MHRIRTLLLVDDDESYRLACVRLLRGRCPDVEVFPAANAPIALEIARRERPDLAIVDLDLDRKLAVLQSGIPLVRMLRVELPRIRIALHSNYQLAEFSQYASGAGADIALEKLDVNCEDIVRYFRDGTPLPLPKADVYETYREATRRFHAKALVDAGGNVSLAAKRIGMSRQALQKHRDHLVRS